MIELTMNEAISLGYCALTTPYKLPDEQWMVNNVMRDMRCGGIDAAIVTTPQGPEVWRKNATPTTTE